MPVNSTHPDYDANLFKWQRCRDCRSGGDAVKARKQAYLPALESTSADPARYKTYLNRAVFYNATARTISGLSGTVFRKDPSIVSPDALLPALQDITLTHVPLASFALSSFEEILTTGRYGVLVDLPAAEDVPEEHAADIRPYWVPYRAEQIINWRTASLNGRLVLTLLVLKELVEEPDQHDEFVPKVLTQYRVLRLAPDGYEVQLYRQVGSDPNAVEVLGPTRQPVRRGERLAFIPFYLAGPTSVTADVAAPPLLDLVDVNLSHYRTSADLEHGRHYTALPTPYVAGVPPTTQLEIGSGSAWVFSDPQAHAGMVEFTGSGLQALERAMATKEAQMAVLGARLLESQKPSVESSDTLRTRQNGEQSVLRTMAGTLSQVLTMALRTTVWWMGLDIPDEECHATLNTEFFSLRLSGDEATALVTLWQAGGISFDTLYWNLERGEWTKPGVTIEQERQLIDADQAEKVDQNYQEQALLLNLSAQANAQGGA